MSRLITQPLEVATEFHASAVVGRRMPIVWKVAESFRPLAWTWDSLADAIGNLSVQPLVDMPKSGVFARDFRTHERRMSFSDFAALAQSDPIRPCYLAYLRPRDMHIALHEQANFGFLQLQGSHGADTRVWMGSAGTNSGLHSDLKDNIFVQLRGRKRLFLVSPSDTHYVYPQIDNIVNSEVSLPVPDFERHPELQKATVYHAVVKPGDAVYIPRGWWHGLIALEDSISINHWFGPPVSDAEYIRLICRQGVGHVARAIFDMLRYGLLKLSAPNDFFFTPPPNGARLYGYLRHGSFSRDNDPHLDP